MAKKLLPACVTTIEALKNCSNSSYPLLYISERLYTEHTEYIHQFAIQNGYEMNLFPAHYGLYLSKNIAPGSTDIRDCSDYWF